MPRTKEEERLRIRLRRAEAKAAGMCRNCFARPAAHGAYCDRCWEKRDPLPAMRMLCGGEPRCQCPGCGQTLPKFLSIDHVHNDGYKERRGSDMASRPGPGTRIAAVFEDPSRYQVLCCNCNLAKGHGKGGKCPYEGTPH